LGYLFGILLGYWLLLKLIRKPGSPMSREHADDMILYATLGIILGGRIGYVLILSAGNAGNAVGRYSSCGNGGMSLHGGTHWERYFCDLADGHESTASPSCACVTISPVVFRSACSSSASRISPTANCGAG
jgi:hypothetical protein